MSEFGNATDAQAYPTGYARKSGEVWIRGVEHDPVTLVPKPPMGRETGPENGEAQDTLSSAEQSAANLSGKISLHEFVEVQ